MRLFLKFLQYETIFGFLFENELNIYTTLTRTYIGQLLHDLNNFYNMRLFLVFYLIPKKLKF